MLRTVRSKVLKMKKLGILGVLVLLVALVFVPHGVMAKQTDSANLTITAGVQHAIELTIDSANYTVDTYGENETFSGFNLDPASGTETASAGTLKVQCNKAGWYLKAIDFRQNEGIMSDGVNDLTNPLKIAKVSSWDNWATGVTPGDHVALTNDGTNLLDVVGLATSPKSGVDGAFIPIEVSQVITYDDVVSDDYAIVISFEGGYS